MWHFDIKGTFSVKSSYPVLEDGEERNRKHQCGQSSSGGGSKSVTLKLWKKIWKLQCSPKIQQLFGACLPLKMNIKRKGIDLDTKCPVCLCLDDGAHCFSEMQRGSGLLEMAADGSGSNYSVRSTIRRRVHSEAVASLR